MESDTAGAPGELGTELHRPAETDDGEAGVGGGHFADRCAQGVGCRVKISRKAVVKQNPT